MNPRNPRFIDVEPRLNDAGCYTTPAGDIEPGTVEYVIDLLSSTIDNPNNTVSKGKLKHIAAQLLARNAFLEREHDVLRHRVLELQIELIRLQGQANIASVTIDTGTLSAESVSQIKELISLSRGTMTPGTLA